MKKTYEYVFPTGSGLGMHLTANVMGTTTPLRPRQRGKFFKAFS